MAIEAVNCATQLDGLRVATLGKEIAAYDILTFRKNPSWSNNLNAWGEARVVK